MTPSLPQQLNQVRVIMKQLTLPSENMFGVNWRMNLRPMWIRWTEHLPNKDALWKWCNWERSDIYVIVKARTPLLDIYKVKYDQYTNPTIDLAFSDFLKVYKSILWNQRLPEVIRYGFIGDALTGNAVAQNLLFYHSIIPMETALKQEIAKLWLVQM